MIKTKKPADVIDLLSCPYHQGHRFGVHVTNCQHVMGAGIAAALAKQFPEVYATDLNTPKSSSKMGTFSFAALHLTTVQGVRSVYNVYAQEKPGKNPINPDDRAVSYDALYNGLRRVIVDWVLTSRGQPVQMLVPYRIGCGLAGGNWSVVTTILHELSQWADLTYPGCFDILICQREGDE